MISKPQIVYPNNQTIDCSIDNKFSFVFNGDELSSYQITIIDSITLATIYTSPRIDTTSYNNDTVTMDVPKIRFLMVKTTYGTSPCGNLQ